MALFVVTQRHSPERCPASDPKRSAFLHRRLSKEGAKAHGVTVHGEALIDGLHILHMILEADDRGQVEKFMAPFAQGGSVAVLPASSCEDVLSRESC